LGVRIRLWKTPRRTDKWCNGAFVLAFMLFGLCHYSVKDPRADVNYDGQWNFFDSSLFLSAFNASYPEVFPSSRSAAHIHAPVQAGAFFIPQHDTPKVSVCMYSILTERV
jgi:hypothetical protein